MKQELTITILLLAAGAGLWMWQSDLTVPALIHSESQTKQLDSQLSTDSEEIDSIEVDSNDQQPWAATAGDPQTVKFLRTCAANLRNVPAFKTELQIDLNLSGGPTRLTGEYLQSGQGGLQSRTELRLPTANGQISLLKICDGRFLYTQFKTPEKKSLEFVDLNLCTQRRNHDQQAEPGNPMRWIADGGLSSVFENLAEAFEFEPVEIQNVGDSRISTVRGTWNQTKLAELLHRSIETTQGQSRINWEQLPIHLPHSVEIEFVEHQSFGTFPQRFEMFRFRQDERQRRQRVPVALIQFSAPQVSTIAASELVKLETDNAEAIDATGQYVNQIINFNYARRAAKQSDTQSR
jgi:hypothetical protein